MFHDTYEALAPNFGHETRKETREFSPDTPNGQLMIAVCDHVIKTLFKGPKPIITTSYSCREISTWVNDSFGATAANEFDEWIESYLDEWNYYDGGIINFNTGMQPSGKKVPDIVLLTSSLYGDEEGILTLYV